MNIKLELFKLNVLKLLLRGYLNNYNEGFVVDLIRYKRSIIDIIR